MLAHSQITSVFKSSPFPSLILHPGSRFTIAGVNQAYLNATGTTEEEIAGKGLFGVLHEAPGDKITEEDARLKSSLEQVLTTKAPDRMPIRQYRLPHSTFAAAEPEYRMPVNSPVLNEEGEIAFILFTAVSLRDQDVPVVNEEGAERQQRTISISGKKLAEEQKNGALHKLKERIKEQSCLYRISSLNEQELTVEELLDEAVAILPGGWQYPDVSAAAIEYAGNTYTTPRYYETPWIMSAETGIKKESLLTVNVVYLEERPLHDKGPFLKEERKLIDSIIRHLALKIDRILSQYELKEKQQLLDKAYQLARIGTWEYDMLTQELKWSTVTKEVHGFGPDYQPDVESTIALFKEGLKTGIHLQKLSGMLLKKSSLLTLS